jgi:AraC-like DNA-binding protein
VIALAMMRASGDDLFASPVPTAAPAATPDIAMSSAADRKLAAALNELMERERIYRREGLTIGALATRLGVPEYRLRRLINGTLGHRNFNAFLNAHRIAEAKAALADPAQAEVPVTTIALDAGFQSLGPFNRAFKTETGLTPSEFRRGAGIATTS